MPILRVTPEYITSLKPNEIFVFGSNLAGMHGGGAARMAHMLFGAEMGANAIVGVSFGYETMGQANGMIMISISGTAVVID